MTSERLLNILYLPKTNFWLCPWLSRVGGGVHVQNSQLVGVSLDEPKQICQQRSRVALCRRCERACRQSWLSLQFPVLLSYWDWWHNGVTVEKVSNIDKNSLSQTAIHGVCLASFQIGDRIRRQSSWASCEFSTHRRRDSIRQLSRVGAGGMCWALRQGERSRRRSGCSFRQCIIGMSPCLKKLC